MSDAIFLRRVRDNKILSGRQLATESGLSTVTATSDNWWTVFRYHICIILFVSFHLLEF